MLDQQKKVVDTQGACYLQCRALWRVIGY